MLSAARLAVSAGRKQPQCRNIKRNMAKAGWLAGIGAGLIWRLAIWRLSANSWLCAGGGRIGYRNWRPGGYLAALMLAKW